MHAFAQRLAERIENPQSDTIADSLIDVGEIMRMWRFFGGDPGGSAVLGPFSEQTNFPHVQADDVERLHKALVVFVTSHPRHPDLSGAVHGLSYRVEPSTKNLLIGVLRDCLGRDPFALYQAILALEALGENLYGKRQSTSADEVERNERVARDYLASLSESN
jgi:hypothetical protein